MALLLLVVLTHTVLPLAMLAVLIWRPASSWLGWVAEALGLLSPALLILLAGAEWSRLSMYARPALVIPVLGLLVTAVLRRVRTRPHPIWPRGFRAWLSTTTYVLVAAWLGFAVASAALGHRAPNDALAVESPLAHPRVLVLSGGASPVLNGHATVEAQRYALDIGALTSAGRRLHGLVPQSLEDYVAFGLPVVAPCSGTVAAVHAAERDHPGPASDPVRPAGNHVVLHCGDSSLVLAHLRAGSILARAGAQVQVGDPIGQVGNTGNSTEPHLHMHAVRGRTVDLNELQFVGEPIALRLGSEREFAVRGDVVEGRPRAARP